MFAITRAHVPLLLAAAVLLASCSWRSSPPLRISIVAWPPAEFLHLAREKGFFAAEGVDVRIIEFTSPADAHRALAHGRIDGGVYSIFEVLRVRDRSKPDLQIALVIDSSSGADAIVARDGIATVADLQGKRVAFDGGPLGIYMLARAFEPQGMSLEDVTLALTHAADMPRALRTGLVDAAVTYPPARTKLEQLSGARAIYTSATMPREIFDVLAFDAATLAERPEDVAALIRAYYRAVDYATANPTEALAIMAQREHLSPTAFQHALQDGLSLISLREQARLLGPNSPIPAVARRADRIMRASGELLGPPSKVSLLAPAAAMQAAAGNRR